LAPEHTFGLGIFDEAHKTACAERTGRNALALHDSNARIERRIFFTATPRMRRVRKSLHGDGATSYSMDDARVYGGCVCLCVSLTFHAFLLYLAHLLCF
jgi:predicted helicase